MYWPNRSLRHRLRFHEHRNHENRYSIEYVLWWLGLVYISIDFTDQCMIRALNSQVRSFTFKTTGNIDQVTRTASGVTFDSGHWLLDDFPTTDMLTVALFHYLLGAWLFFKNIQKGLVASSCSRASGHWALRDSPNGNTALLYCALMTVVGYQVTPMLLPTQVTILNTVLMSNVARSRHPSYQTSKSTIPSIASIRISQERPDAGIRVVLVRMCSRLHRRSVQVIVFSLTNWLKIWPKPGSSLILTRLSSDSKMYVNSHLQ